MRVVERSILGEHPVFGVPGAHSLDDARSLLVYALLGVAAAVVAVAFTDLVLGLRGWFRRLHRVPDWLHPAGGRLLTGAIALAALFAVDTPGVAGGVIARRLFPVTDENGRVMGLVTPDELRILLAEPDLVVLTNAMDLMRPPVILRTSDSLRFAFERLRLGRLRELPVVDDDDRVLGFVDEGALARVYLASAPASTREL